MYLTHAQAKQKVLKEKYNGITTEAYLADCVRIDAHEPWEYVLGYAEFLGCRIDLSHRPMVPRYETAFWVEKVIGEWKGKGPLRALDLYSGSGNIGIALLKHLPNAHVTFNELDATLLPQIEKSIEGDGLDLSRVTLVAGDSFEKIKGTFDVICANPPYVDPKGEGEMDPEMRYEPHMAFFGSRDGYGQHREIIEKAAAFLTPRGGLYLECDMTQVEELKHLLSGAGWQYAFWEDPYGHENVAVMSR